MMRQVGHGRSAERERPLINPRLAQVDRDITTTEVRDPGRRQGRHMTVQELKRRVADGYDVDPSLVAEALLRRNGLAAIAGAIAGEPPLSDGARSRAGAGTPRAAGPRRAPR
jgi:hypothetical protein